LLCSKAKGRRKVVWLHTPAKSTGGVIHTVRRHGGRVQDVVVLGERAAATPLSHPTAVCSEHKEQQDTI
jgi:hypothetical protein